jgi:hypothetical protein
MSFTVRRSIVALLLLLVVPAAASAQDHGDAGIAMGYPSAVAFVWHASDSIAIRPEFTATRTSSEVSVLGSDRKTKSWSAGVGASALFYLSHADSLRTYVSPRATYTRGSTETAATSSIPASPANTVHAYSLTGSFGAQYSLSERFSAFGEIGFGVTHARTTTDSAIVGSESSSNSWGTRTGVGVILYF